MKNPSRIKLSMLARFGIGAMACCALACTKTPDARPTPKSVDSTLAPKAAPTTAATPTGPKGPTKIGMPQVCNLGPCHGLDDLVCTRGAPMMCTDIYKHGDFCRQFVECDTAKGACVLKAQPKFAECKACMDGCKTELTCEATCRDQLKVP